MSLYRVGAFKKLISATGRMATLDDIIANNKRGEELLEKISAQLLLAKESAVAQRKQQLRAENAALLQQVERAKAELIALEVKKGIKQISLPGVRNLCTDAGQQSQQQQTQAAPAASTEDAAKPPKEKKPKKEKPAGEPKKGGPAAAEAELPVDVSRLDMRVGKIIEVGRHPDADSLYLEKIDCGEAQPRTVVSGLVKFVPLEEMQNRMVVVMCNLKPAKMRGVLSEAMVMCASTPEKVEVLSPPAGAVPGDLVHCTGYTRQPDAQLNPKKKIFETCAPDLMTNGELVACYKGAALHVPGKGNVVAQSLKNVHVK